jgi:peptidoglycan/xylan/chitin deacetylase (PgdA/CDA1 family)
MERRDALRAATALSLGALAGCAPAAVPAAPSSPTSPAPSPSAAAEASPTGPTLPDEVRHGPRDRPQLALTFHGQGDPALVTALLDELRRGNAPVTVLAVGTWLTANRDLGRRILADGHELGNHTMHHANIKTMKPQLAYAEISACAQAVRTVAGSIGRWFRPSQTPYATPTIKAAARRAGYPTCLSYDVDPRDYTDPGAHAIVAATLAAAGPGSIVSLHCGHEGTVAAIAPLLAGLRARNLRPVTASGLFA